MVEWLDLGRSVAFDIFKLFLFWWTETVRGKGGSDSEKPRWWQDIGNNCIDHFSQHLVCERDRDRALKDLELCESRGVLSSLAFGWLVGVGCSIIVLSLLGNRCDRKPVVGEPVELVVPYKSPLALSDPFEGLVESEDESVVAARRRARSLRG